MQSLCMESGMEPCQPLMKSESHWSQWQNAHWICPRQYFIPWANKNVRGVKRTNKKQDTENKIKNELIYVEFPDLAPLKLLVFCY